MDSEPLPDHYKALGVEPTALVAAIKAAHRKLVLTCHPDKVKVTDPALKQQKQEEFHRIQKAYEVLSDEKERAKYDAEVTLEALRKKNPSASQHKSTRFESSRPSAGNSSSTRYATEEFRPSGSYEDHDKYYDDRDRDRARGSTRSKNDTSRSRFDTYDAYPKTSRSTEKESSRSAKATTDRARSDRTKARDKDERRERERSDRSRFHPSVDSESSADEKARYEANYKRRSQEDEAKRQAAEARRKAEERRAHDERYASTADPRARKLSSQEEEARMYQHKSRAQVEAEMTRPSPTRTSSRDYYGESRRKESRPETVRRSSAQPKERRGSSGRERERERDRGIPEIVEWGGEDSSRRPPTLKQYNSSPATIEVPRAMPTRAYTAAEPSSHHRSSSPPPALYRSSTMPSNAHSTSRSSKPTPSRPSTLRETMTPEHPSEFPTVPQPQSSSGPKRTVYHYPTPVAVRPEDILPTTHRTVLREPDRQPRHRSPSPLTRPPMGANRPSEQTVPTTGGRTSRNVSPAADRGRSSRPLYGEVRPRPARNPSYDPATVQYAQRFGPDDIRWAPRGRENEREFPAPKPGLSRHATMAY